MISLVFGLFFAVVLLFVFLWVCGFLLDVWTDRPKSELSDRDKVIQWLPALFFLVLLIVLW